MWEITYVCMVCCASPFVLFRNCNRESYTSNIWKYNISSTYQLEHDFPGRKADMYDSSRMCCLDMCRFTKLLYVYLHLNLYMPSSMFMKCMAYLLRPWCNNHYICEQDVKVGP